MALKWGCEQEPGFVLGSERTKCEMTEMQQSSNLDSPYQETSYLYNIILSIILSVLHVSLRFQCKLLSVLFGSLYCLPRVINMKLPFRFPSGL